MLTVEQPDGVKLNIMSVHNNTYVVILLERQFNISFDRAGVALDFNKSGSVWAWVAGSQFLINDHHVKSSADLHDDTLTVVFGRPLAAEGSEVEFKDNTPYSGFVAAISWDNGSALSSISFKMAPSFGLELLPYLNSYPTQPLVYSSVILGAGSAFIFIEVRRYRGTRKQ